MGQQVSQKLLKEIPVICFSNSLQLFIKSSLFAPSLLQLVETAVCKTGMKYSHLSRSFGIKFDFYLFAAIVDPLWTTANKGN